MRKLFLIGPIIFIVIWILISYLELVNEFFLPKPDRVLFALWDLIVNKNLILDIQSTIFRWLLGLAIGMIIGIPLGIAMGNSKRLYNLLEVLMDFFRSIPTITLFPLFLVFFGIGDISKVLIGAWATILYVFINALYGVRQAKEFRIKVAKTFHATKSQIFIKVVLPEAMPSIFVGIRIAISMSLVVIVASEMIMGTTYGLGRKIFDSALVFAIPEMYASIIITGLLGYLSNKLFLLFENRIVHWVNK